MKKKLHIFFAALLAASFFLPWVKWGAVTLNGAAFPLGKFFQTSQTLFGLSNPFPKLNFAFYLLWLIPVLSAVVIKLSITNKKTFWPACIAAAMALGLLSIYFLFTHEDIGAEANSLQVFKWGAYISIVSALGLLATTDAKWFLQLGGLVIGPLFAFISHGMVVNYYNKSSFQDTSKTKPDYTVSAVGLLKEFETDSSMADKKYTEKIIEVSGNVSQTEPQGDSTINIKFADSTGSYLVFTTDKQEYTAASKIKEGNPVVLRGSCSGSLYSEILSASSISFKRVTIVKQ